MNLKVSNKKTKIVAPITSTIVDVNVKDSSIVSQGQIIVTVESMKMQSHIVASAAGIISDLKVTEGETVEEGQLICCLTTKSNHKNKESISKVQINNNNQALYDFEKEIEKTLDKEREQEVIKRHSKGYRTARENLEDLVDADSFVEYGQLAVAAQRERLNADELKLKSAADGVLTGLATINSDQHGEKASQVARDPLIGQMFENLVVMECVKARTNLGRLPNLYFYRDSNGNEADILFQDGRDLVAIEIKSSSTYQSGFLKALKKIMSLSPDFSRGMLVYAGDDMTFSGGISALNFKRCESIIC